MFPSDPPSLTFCAPFLKLNHKNGDDEIYNYDDDDDNDNNNNNNNNTLQFNSAY